MERNVDAHDMEKELGYCRVFLFILSVWDLVCKVRKNNVFELQEKAILSDTDPTELFLNYLSTIQITIYFLLASQKLLVLIS